MLSNKMSPYIKFTLHRDKYKQIAREGFWFLIIFILAYFAFFFGANSLLIQESYILASAMYFMAGVFIIASTVTKAKYPFIGFYKNDNIFIESLKEFTIK